MKLKHSPQRFPSRSTDSGAALTEGVLKVPRDPGLAKKTIISVVTGSYFSILQDGRENLNINRFLFRRLATRSITKNNNNNNKYNIIIIIIINTINKSNNYHLQ